MPDMTFPSGQTDLRAYLAVPRSGGPWPGVVVVQDAFGLSDVTRQHADRFAAAGYIALAPDLYTRGGALRCVRDTMRAAATRSGQAFDDINAARQWLEGRDDCTGKIGIIGFCMGGGFALAMVDQGFAVSAPNYGMLPDNFESILNGACPVVASYGAKDKGIRGGAAKLEAALRSHGVEHDVKEYPDAGHSFMDRHNVGPAVYLMRAAGLGYHHASAEDAWKRILAFFDRHLESGAETTGETPAAQGQPAKAAPGKTTEDRTSGRRRSSSGEGSPRRRSKASPVEGTETGDD